MNFPTGEAGPPGSAAEISTNPPARRPVRLACLAATLLVLAADAQADEPVLAWGNEKVLSTSIECVGAATQDFTITVE